jgi:hypothetical protein
MWASTQHSITRRFNNYYFLISGGWTLGTAATTGLLYQPRIIGEGDCGEIGRIKIGR